MSQAEPCPLNLILEIIMYSKFTTFCLACSFIFTLALPGNALAMELVSGKIKETMDSGGYTYVLLELEGKDAWAAIPTVKVAVGDMIKLQPGMVMHNFTSSTLNRTFDSIIFSGGLVQ
jgi:hypothetical protein